MSDKSPRIPPLPRSAWTDEARDVFAVLEGQEGWEKGPRYDVISIMAQHPQLTRPFLTYNRFLMFHLSIDPRQRELVILYVAWTCHSEYEWLSHIREGKRIGLTDEDIEAVKVGASSDHWTDFERMLFQTVDQMCRNYDVDDATWAALTAVLDTKQVMELLFMIGNYIMFSSVLSAMRIQPEAGEAGAALIAQYGTPAR